MSGLAKFFRVPSDDDSPADYTKSLVDASSNESSEEGNDEPLDASKSWVDDWNERKAKIIFFVGDRMESEENDEADGTSTLSDPTPKVSKVFVDATSLSQVNLQARSLQLDLCRVERFWELRKNARGKKLPILPQHLQDDGMLAVVYKARSVISVELLVYDTAKPSATRDHVQRLHNIQQYKRLHVFFYREYAHKMAELLKKETKKSSAEVYLSLAGIPALCILPHQQHGCWYSRQQTCPFSVCIGDSSLMDAGNNTLRFDTSKDFDIQVLRVRDKAIECFQIQPHDEVGATLEEVDECSLKATYITHILSPKDKSNQSHTETSTNQGETATAEQPDAQQLPEPGEKESTSATIEQTDVLPVPEHGDKDRTAAAPEHVVTDRAKRSATEAPSQGKSKRSRVLLEFTKTLMDVRDLHRDDFKGKVDICAVVLSCTQPWRTKRGDWTMTLSLIDDTLPIIEDRVDCVNVVLFVKEQDFDMLPKIHVGGDIVLLQGLDMNTYRDEIQLQGAGREKKSKRYAAFRDQKGDDINDRVGELWRWGQKRFLQQATIKQSHQFSIADMRPQENTQTEWYGSEKASQRGDITVVVTAILMVPEDMEKPRPQCFLRVWDGTGPPTSDNWPLDTPEAEEAIQSGDPPEVVLSTIAEVIQQLRAHDGISELAAPKQLTGRVVNVAFWEPQHAELVLSGLVRVGSLIRLRNVNDSLFSPRSNFRCLHMGAKSSCTPLPNLTREFVSILENHQERLQRKDPMNPTSAVLPLGPDEQPPPTPRRPVTELVSRPGFVLKSLREFIVAHHSVEFDGVVRIAGTIPNLSTLSTTSFSTICPKRKGRVFYQFVLRLEQDDSPIVLDTLVPDAEPTSMQVGQLVFGLPAADALQNNEQALKNAEAIEKERAQWHAKIRCRTHNGQKFFIVTKLVKK